MKTFSIALIAFLLGAAAVALLRPHAEGDKPPAETTGSEKHGETEGETHADHGIRIEHGPHGETLLQLNPETSQRIGLAVQAIARVKAGRETTALGKVVDPAPLTVATTDWEAATAALEASNRDYQRLKALHERGQGVSARAVEAADALGRRDEMQWESARLRLMTGWGPAVATNQALHSMVDRLARQEGGLALLHLPLGEAEPASPLQARLSPLDSESRSLAATFLGTAVTVDAQIQGRSYLFLLTTNPPPPGTPLKAWITISGEPSDAAAVPESAIIRQEGKPSVYLQNAKGNFRRISVRLEHPTDNGWLVRESFEEGDQLVVRGAQELLSEELKGQGGEE